MKNPMAIVACRYHHSRYFANCMTSSFLQSGNSSGSVAVKVERNAGRRLSWSRVRRIQCGRAEKLVSQCSRINQAEGLTSKSIGLITTLVLIGALTYVVDWLHKLDSSTSLGGGMVSFMEDPTSLEKIPLPSVFGPAEKYLSLIMPAYNEEDRLRNSLDDTLRYLQDRASKDKSFTYEIIIIDDGSRDSTVRVAFEYVKKFKIDTVRVIKQGKNHGKGAAVRKGMLCSRGQLLLMLDADGATKITDTGKLESQIKFAIDRLTSRNATNGRQPRPSSEVPVVAFGSRAHLEADALAKRKWYRNVLMKGFHLCVLLVAGPGIRDTQCGFKMFTRSAARQLFTNMRLNRWCFDVELVYLCKRLAIPVQEVAVTWTEIPGSKISLLSIVHMLFELVLIRMGYGFGLWKIHRKVTHD